MDQHRKKRLAQLIRTRYKGNRTAFIDEAGISKGRVTQLLKPEDSFGERAARELERKLNLPERWLDLDDVENTEPAPAVTGSVPLISWVQAGDWEEAHDHFQPGEAEAWYGVAKQHSKHTYALRVRGDSMTASHGKSYPEGSIIIVEPERKMPSNGERIIAKLSGTSEVTFKVYKEEDGRRWLQPLNPAHLPIREPFHVLGTVIGKWEDD
jgi:SOS-response transcriptional repressor LexA